MEASPRRAIVIAGGELHVTPTIGSGDLVVAADSGYDHAVLLGVPVDVLVGDLDSISPTGAMHARENKVDVEEYPPDKDSTDLELALEAAADRGATKIDIYGGEDGRIDHLLGVALSISRDAWDSIDVAWHTRTGVIHSVTRTRPLVASAVIGDVVSLIPVGDAFGVTTTGLSWPLEAATLERGVSLGISNKAVSDTISVVVQAGTVLVVTEEAGQ